MKNILAIISHYKDSKNNRFYRDNTRNFVNKGFPLFKHLFSRYKDLKIYFYYSIEQPIDLTKKLQEQKIYDVFILGENTFLVPLNQEFFNSPEAIERKILKSKSNFDLIIDMSYLLINKTSLNNIPIFHSDNFSFCQFPYHQSIYWTQRLLSFSRKNYLSYYLKNPSKINYKQNSQFVIDEIRQFNSKFLRLLSKKRILNYIKGKRKNQKVLLVPITKNLTPLYDWKEITDFFIQEIFPKIPSNIDIVITIHKSFWKDKKYASYKNYFEQFISKQNNIIYHKKLFCISENASQWLILYVDGILLTQDIGSIAVQAFLYGKEVFYVQDKNSKIKSHGLIDNSSYVHNYYAYPSKIFKHLANQSDISSKNNQDIEKDKIIYALFKNHCYFQYLSNEESLVDQLENIVKSEEIKPINSDLDILHQLTPYKYKVLKSGEIKRVRFSCKRIIFYLKNLLKINKDFYRRFFNLSKNKYWK